MYGYCPMCNGRVINRERRPDGDDQCENGHKFKTSLTMVKPSGTTELTPSNEIPVIPWNSTIKSLLKGM
jgi:hypothetical protein